MQKRFFFTVYAGVLLLVLFSSCVSSPEQPKWIDQYPSDDKYYIGIGSSNDPVQSIAAAKARQDALANLAASISTSIIAETEIESSETAGGERLQSIQRRIQENISQTLEGVEVADSFYSNQYGYWIFMRIPRNQIQRQKRELSERIEALLVPVFSDEALSTAEALSLLDKGHALLLSTPYFAVLSGELGKEKGILLDLIEKKTASLLSTLKISVTPEQLEGRGGQIAETSVIIQGEKPEKDLPIVIRIDDEILVSGTSAENGQLTFPVDFSRIPVGIRNLNVDLYLEALGINRSSYYLNLPRVSSTLSVHVQPLPLRFIMEFDDAISLQGIPEMASSLFFTSGLPFSLAEGTSDSEYILRCRLFVEDFPRYRENSLEISQARLIIQIEFQNEILYTYQSSSTKDGGLTITQAHERTIKKLFQKLENEREYLPGLIDVLPIKTEP